MLIKKACKSDWVLKLIKRCFFQLTLPILYISESCICIKMKINFALLYGASKGVMNALIEIKINFLFSHFFMCAFLGKTKKCENFHTTFKLIFIFCPGLRR